MSTSQQLTVYKNFPTAITVKAEGYYDYTTTKTFTTAGETVNIPSSSMTVYDGLDYSFSTSNNDLYLADFSATTLPNYNTPSATLYAMKATGQTYSAEFTTGEYNNVTIVGTPNLDTTTGMSSGFSSTSYFELPQSFPSGDKEIVLKIKRENGTTSIGAQNFFAPKAQNYGFYLSQDNKPSFWTGSAYVGVTSLQNDTWYWIKITRTASNNRITIYSLLDNGYTKDTLPATSSWTQEYSTILGDILNGAVYCVGNSGYSLTYPLVGSIDLSQCFITIDGYEWWTAYKTTTITQNLDGCLYNYTDDGSAVTLNAFQTSANKIVLTPDVSYAGTKLGTVSVPSHSV